MIYVLTSGSYSDYRVHGVYTTKELAEFAQNIFDSYYEFDIEKYELDGPVDLISKARNGLYLFRVDMFLNGDTNYVRRVPDYEDMQPKEIELSRYQGSSNDLFFKCNVFAKDEQHAVKIVNEKRIQYIALNGVPTKVDDK